MNSVRIRKNETAKVELSQKLWVGLCHLAWQRDLFWVLPEGKAAPKPVREAYGALVAKLIGGEVPNAKKVAETTVGERCSIFLYWAESELRAEERQSNSAIPVPVLGLFGKKAASDFGPVKLRRIQQWFVVPPPSSPSGRSRGKSVLDGFQGPGVESFLHQPDSSDPPIRKSPGGLIWSGMFDGPRMRPTWLRGNSLTPRDMEYIV